VTSRETSSVFSVLKNRDYRRLWLADVVSDAGSFITFIALAVYVHDLTGEALAVGFAVGLRAIPWLTLGPIGGVIADRFDRRLMMVICDVARAALVALLPFTDTVGQAYAISFASGLFGPVFRPARRALIPTVVPGEQFVQAVALGEVTHQIMHTIGPALGGVAVLAVGARNAFFVDSGTFLVSAALLIGLGVRGPVRGRPTGLADVRRDLAEGGRLLFGDRLLRSIVLFDAVVLFGYAGTFAVMIVYVRESLGRGAGTYGVLLGASGFGTALGAYLLARRGRRVRRGPALGAAALGSAALGFLALRPGFAPLMVLMFLVGASFSGTVLYVETTVAERVPDQARGRVFGLMSAIAEFFDLAGAVGVAAMADRIGAGPAIAVGGAIAAGLGLAVLAPAARALRQDDAERDAAAG
jgi:MFS transporter, NRE family, putaive nickel resistance protein